jgi:NAD+ synthase
VRSCIAGFGEGWTYRLRLPGDLRESNALNVYRLEAFDPEGIVHHARLSADALHRMQAATAVKQRLRMLRLYDHAEQRGYLVSGTTNRTEMVQGFFVRHGDGGVDVEVLAHLYKTQVFALGHALGVPQAILDRAPSPDTYSAPVTDEEFYFRLPYAALDGALSCFEDELSVSDAARETNLEEDVVRRIYDELRRRRDATQRLRELPPNLLDMP